jgi:hypothetical protein
MANSLNTISLNRTAIPFSSEPGDAVVKICGGTNDMPMIKLDCAMLLGTWTLSPAQYKDIEFNKFHTCQS